MKAVTCTDSRLEVAEVPDPVPANGQLLIEVTRCGICGSDLHARHHCDELAEVMADTGYDAFMRSEHSVVLGHEFTGEVADHGPGSRRRLATGTPIVAMPLLRRDDGIHGIGLSESAPGGYAEQLLVEESLALPVTNGLAAEVAALTEPLAVGLHAVRRGDVAKRQVAIVVGCGPVGLAVILMLKGAGVKTVVASDFSAARRELAAACGADVVVDPREGSPFSAAAGRGHLTSAPEAFELAVGTMEKLRRLPLPWHHVMRIGERLGAGAKHPVVFECVGVPGVIDEIITAAPLFSRVVVVGVCMGDDRIRPSMAINKEIDLRFVLAYTPVDFRDALHMLAEGKVDPRPLLTGEVGLPGVEAAFDALADPEEHAKILIDPRSATAKPERVSP